jgi:hypothetical protein
MRISLEHWRTIMETTSWQQPTDHNSKPGSSCAVSRYRNLQQLSSSCPIGPLSGCPKTPSKREASHVFVDGMRDQEVKQHLLTGGMRSLNKPLTRPSS